MKKNSREDFVVFETFETLDAGGDTVPALVPEHVRVEFYVKSLFKSVLCERKGNRFFNCRLASDGHALECAIPQFVKGGLGLGLLKHRVTIVFDNDVFPASEQYVPVPELVTLEDGSHIELVEGPGDFDEDNPIWSRPIILVPGESSGHAVLYSEQNLTEEEKAQARENIGASPDRVLVSKTYAELKAMRDDGTLAPGTVYRITDYVATTSNAESRSVGHAFDILVTALDANHLSEEAGACLHSGDTYFANTNFPAWKVWYCLDNDTTRFNWAETTNGKGVIYRLIDEWKNDVPYDFKSIQFKRYKVTAQTAYSDALSSLNGMYIGLPSTYSKGFDIDTSDFKWFYTFTKLGATWNDDISDNSILGTGANNTDFGATQYNGARALNNIVCANGGAISSVFLGSTYNVNRIATNVHFGESANHLSFFGGIDSIYAKTLFRRNIIFAYNRLNDYGSLFQDNTIVVLYDFAMNHFGEYNDGNVIFVEYCLGNNTSSDHFSQNYIVVNGATSQFMSNRFRSTFKQNTFFLIGNSNCNVFGQNFLSNTGYGTIGYCQFAPNISNNIFGTQEIPVSMHYDSFGSTFRRNTILGANQVNVYEGQITDCEFGEGIYACTFNCLLTFVTIPSSTSSNYFSAVDVKGNIRGTSETKVTLDASAFFLSTLSGISRRVAIEGDTNGKITATWMSAGKRIGITKGVGDIAWTDLPALAYASDLSNFITKSVNDLTNYYLKSETYTQAEVNALIGAIQHFHYEVATSTSAVTNPASNVLYLIGPTGSGADKYEEYVYPDSTTGWVKIGDTSIDLSGYVTTSALNTALADYTTTANLMTLLAGKQGYYTVPTSRVANPKEGDICDVPESVVAADLQNSASLSQIDLNGGTKLRITPESFVGSPSDFGSITVTGRYDAMPPYGMYGSGPVCTIQADTSMFTGQHDIKVTINGVVSYFGPSYQRTSFDFNALVYAGDYSYPAHDITIVETIGSGQTSLLETLKIDSMVLASVMEYKNGSWIDRKNFPTSFDTTPTQNSENLMKSGAIYNALRNIPGFQKVFTLAPADITTTPNEGDISAPPRDGITVSFYGSTDLTSYSTKKIMLVPTTAATIPASPDIVVRFSDNTSQTYDARTCGTLVFDAGVVSSVEASPYALMYIYAFLPPKIYHDGAWVDIDAMFLALDTVLANAQGYYNVPTSQISSPKEGDLSIVATSEEQVSVGSSATEVDLTPYSTQAIHVTPASSGGTISMIYATLADTTSQPITEETTFAPGAITGITSFMVSIPSQVNIYAVTPGSSKVYHDGSWIDLDTMFPTVDNTPTANSSNLVKSGGVYSEIHPAVASSQPAGGMLPNVVYDLGTLTGTVTFALATPSDASIPNAYHWTFDNGSTAPTVNWPNGIIWPDNFTPSTDTGKHYEVFVRNGYASMLVYTIPS